MSTQGVLEKNIINTKCESGFLALFKKLNEAF